MLTTKFFDGKVSYFKTCPISCAIVYDEDKPRSLIIAQLDEGLHIEPTSATPKVSQFALKFFLHIGSLKKYVLCELIS